MNPSDFIFSQVYRGALSEKVNERIAKDHAVMALNKFKKGQFKKPVELIKESIRQAKKASK